MGFLDLNSQIPNPGNLGFFLPKNPEGKIGGGYGTGGRIVLRISHTYARKHKIRSLGGRNDIGPWKIPLGSRTSHDLTTLCYIFTRLKKCQQKDRCQHKDGLKIYVFGFQ